LVGKCSNFLSNVHLYVDNDDMWLWQLEQGGAYSIRGAYLFLISSQSQSALAYSYLI